MDDTKSLIWRSNAWINSTTLYNDLVKLCVNDKEFTSGLAGLLDMSEVDAFAKNIVNLYTPASQTLSLIKHLIYDEFNSKMCSEGEGCILRGNNVVNKIEGAYVRLVGANYLRFVLSDLVTSIVQDKDLRMEIDPRKITGDGDDEEDQDDKGNEVNLINPELAIIQNQKTLIDMAQAFIDRITDPMVVEEMPREIRAIADYTAESALKYAPESLAPLVGGFLMLRFFCPAIVTPEYSKLIAPEIVPSRRAKRNLVLLAKVLQNTSNGIEFGVKEDFMTCMNGFIVENRTKLTQYFNLICTDPLNRVQKWRDLEGNSRGGPKSPATSSTTPPVSKWTVTIPSSFPNSQQLQLQQQQLLQQQQQQQQAAAAAAAAAAASKQVTQPPPWETYMRNIEIQDLFELHRILDMNKEKLATQLATNPTVSSVLDILKQLGPSPKTKVERKRKHDTTDEVFDKQQAGLINGGSGSFDDLTFMLERARFLFQGPNDKHDKPVFYLIVNRIKPEVFDNVNPLIAHIFKVMDVCVNTSSYTLIVDMSWASISPDMKRGIFTHLPKLAEVFSRKYKKNIDKMFIVHPSAYTRAVVYFMRAFTSRKLKRKIHEVYNWKQLATYIDTENIALPETSKDYITKSYRVVKVNSKGKRQERLIKFTSNSLLNIDPGTKRIQNEKRIYDIEEITSARGSIEMTMKFKDSSNSSTSLSDNQSNSGNTNGNNTSTSKSRIGFLNIGAKVAAVAAAQTDGNRRYVCNDELERDHIVQDIFEAGFKVGLAKYPPPNSSFGHLGYPLPTEYRVIKVNNAGKHQERTFKLTIDSLLNLDQQRIKSENSFAGIDEVALDFENQDIVWLKYKSEPQKRKIICREGEGKMLFEVLTEAIHKYLKLIDSQEGDLKLAAEESSSAYV
ncbi:hypothetical protein SAMD00019534_097330 [Acytostelium subglobosum LB1]|uniref:hypothetical protein n=1 Tax=Acytostelium subglobosum LB1 TaxID=1410327 RepID=UPI000644E252|nr:hypothetical protein SAMD00019534_097330 [Acytostelium subglobosum LB1]GAM26558.1 hypothetical protein SAMD00019534_097330 [Acytostelium subglobosum LB1]|eukprot:XP_012750654.1 hypothetical protein SAMD00019534_097330 [Acytostelium subglobosum LB1]